MFGRGDYLLTLGNKNLIGRASRPTQSTWSSHFCLREEKPYLFLDAVAILPQTARGLQLDD